MAEDVYDFDPSKYAAKIAESEKRVAKAHAFEEADRVPIEIPVGGSYFARMFGYNIRDYYTDLETMVRAQAQGQRWIHESLDDDHGQPGLYLDLGPVYEGLFFDCPLEFHDDTSPRIVPRVETREDVVNFIVPEAEGHPKIEWVFQRHAKFKAIAAKIAPKLPVGGANFSIHPPLSCACAIMDPVKVYEMFYTEPELLERFLDKCLDAYIRIRDSVDKRLGVKRTTLGLPDDNSAFISAEMYRKYVAPRNKALYDRYGSKGRHLHADGPNDHLFPIIADYLKVTVMDIGGFSSMDAAVAAMKGKVVIEGNMNNRDLYGPLSEAAKTKIRHMMRIAGPGGGYVFAIGGEAYVGVPPETMIEMVKYAKEVGKYPISIRE